MTILWLSIPLVLWTLFWKIPALWFSARNGEKAWFVALFFINLVGILEIVYLRSRKCWPFNTDTAQPSSTANQTLFQ
jgi:methionyl-tRNA synthetase